MTDAFDIIASDDCYSVRVPAHSPENCIAAAIALAEDQYGGQAKEYPEAAIWLAGKAQPETYRQHTAESPGDAGCCCEDEGWWCSEGDGPSTPFYAFDRAEFAVFWAKANAEAGDPALELNGVEQ